jgi:hypothetical protein
VLPLVAFKVRGDKKKNWPTEGYGAEFHPQEVPRSRDQAMVIPGLFCHAGISGVHLEVYSYLMS